MFSAQSTPFVIQTHADFLVCYKPPGMETISETGERDATRAIRESVGEPGIVPVHRLDRDTTGIQLFARNRESEKALVDLFRRRLVEKTYLALCLGVPRNRSGLINRNLSEWEGGRRPVRVVKKGGLEASTRYEVLAASEAFPGGWRTSLLAFYPHQGRTHQIRVHAAAIGYPILADDQYGDRAANRLARDELGLCRQALHSQRIALEWHGEKIEAVCPLPPDMHSASLRAFSTCDW